MATRLLQLEHTAQLTVFSMIWLPLRPWLRTCSMTTKNCCRGTWSSPRVLASSRADSISVFMQSFATFRRLALSTRTGFFMTLSSVKKNDIVRQKLTTTACEQLRIRIMRFSKATWKRSMNGMPFNMDLICTVGVYNGMCRMQWKRVHSLHVNVGRSWTEEQCASLTQI